MQGESRFPHPSSPVRGADLRHSWSTRRKRVGPESRDRGARTRPPPTARVFTGPRRPTRRDGESRRPPSKPTKNLSPLELVGSRGRPGSNWGHVGNLFPYTLLLQTTHSPHTGHEGPPDEWSLVYRRVTVAKYSVEPPIKTNNNMKVGKTFHESISSSKLGGGPLRHSSTHQNLPFLESRN